MPFCSHCGRATPENQQVFGRCPVCVAKMTATATEATPFPNRRDQLLRHMEDNRHRTAFIMANRRLTLPCR